MAKPKPNFDGCSLSSGSVVLDGQKIKVRLQKLHVQIGATLVDWLRASVPRSAIVGIAEATLTEDRLMSAWQFDAQASWDSAERVRKLNALIEAIPLDRSCLMAARLLGGEVVEALGAGFSLDPAPKPGRDFFRFRLPIVRNGEEVGWIGGGGTSPGSRQAEITHLNLYGEACMWAGMQAVRRVASVLRGYGGHITRVDLAVDLFPGIACGFQTLLRQYTEGAMDNHGKRPKCNVAGDWANHRACTFYLGSRESKLTRLYAKGDQIFGLPANDPWVRCEVQLSNTYIDLDWEVLDRPDEFFCGLSPWHASVHAEAHQQTVEAEKLAYKPDPALMNAEGEAYRNLLWVFRSAAASVHQALSYLSHEELMRLLEGCGAPVPTRMRRFDKGERRTAYLSAAKRFFSQLDEEPGLVAMA